MEEVGGYRLVALLGEGGMGRVHLGRAASGRLVAVKTVHEHLAADPRFRERFRREAAAARSVAGPFTAAVLAADPAAVRPWLATEFCTGPTLTGAVSALGPLASGELAALGAALAEAIAAVHAAGLVHRDLKPSNIVVTRDGPMVIDFGIARTTAEESLTDSGEVVGSPGFIAPELLSGAGEPGPAVDVFALGALLAYAATARPPFGTGPVHQVLYRTMHGPADLDGVPEGWRELLGSCLAQEPGDRPTVAEVLTACAAWTGGDGAPWWEREAVAGLIRRREEEIAALVANAAGTEAAPQTGTATAERRPAAGAAGPTGSHPDALAGGHTGRPADAPGTPGTTAVGHSPGTTFAPRADAATVVGAGRGTSRRRLLRWGGAALAGGATVGTVAWLSSLTGHDDEGTGSGSSGTPGPYTRGRALWTRDIGEALPIRHGEALYLRAGDGLTRLDARTGTVTWNHPVEGDITDVAVGDELVHVLSNRLAFSTEIVALDAATGVAKWSADPMVNNPRRPAELRGAEATVSVDGNRSTLAVSEDVLCVVTYASYATAWERRTNRASPWRAYGYEPRSGAPLWFHQGAPAQVAALHRTDDLIGVATGTVSPGENGAGSEAAEPLTVLRAADGTLDREIPGGAAYAESYLGSRGIRYYATAGRLEAVDLATRRTRWTRDLPEDETEDTTVTPTATAGLVHTATYGTVRALDADTGRIRWSRTDIGLPLVVADGLVYGRGRAPDGEETPGRRPDWGVHARDAATGDLVWAAETGEASAVVVGAGGDGGDGDSAGAGAGGRSGLVHVASGGVLTTYAAPEPS
ncbi:protein kinase [Streptomyces sp. NPDC006645]|uniref:protein kinase domain-containing protein n=1 Tax=unclassified Streptomyces TaxID=2593676 RepID=UPI0033BADF9F